MTDRPEHAEQPRPSQAQDSRAEQVLSQALRAMVGGDNPNEVASAGTVVGTAAGLSPDGGPRDGGSRRRLTTGQLLLLAAIVGLLVGIAAGLLSLLL